jgi:hypothetical protein
MPIAVIVLDGRRKEPDASELLNARQLAREPLKQAVLE